MLFCCGDTTAFRHFASVGGGSAFVSSHVRIGVRQVVPTAKASLVTKPICITSLHVIRHSIAIALDVADSIPPPPEPPEGTDGHCLSDRIDAGLREGSKTFRRSVACSQQGIGKGTGRLWSLIVW